MLSVKRYIRRVGATVVLCALAASVAACGSDPTPNPTPTPSATPTATPTTVPPSTAQPAATLEGFAITPASTGQDLLDRISEAESDCLHKTFGEAVFGIMANLPLLQENMAPAPTAVILDCLILDNVVLFGIAYLDTLAGGWSLETRACIADVGREHPEAIYDGLGIEAPPQISSAEAELYLLDIYNCMNTPERAQYMASIQAVIGSAASARTNVIDVISMQEAGCIRSALPEADFAMLLQATAYDAFLVSNALTECIMKEGYAAIMASIIDTAIGGISEESTACLIDSSSEQPDYAALINPQLHDTATRSMEEVAGLASVGLRLWDCLNEEELYRMQDAGIRVLSPAR